MAGEEPIEFTLLNKRDAKVYRIPPAASGSGHRADDWKEAIWRGNCRVVGKGKDLTIRLLHANTGELFAQCSIPKGEHEKYVEKVLDSSRYFVLKIANAQRHAFIGFGFSDRGDAFDFNSCISDFKSRFVDRDSAIIEAAIAPPLRDLSLKQGEKLVVNLKGIAPVGTRRRADKAGGLGGALLSPPPPPPPSGKLVPPPPPSTSPLPFRNHATSRQQPLAAGRPPVEIPQEDFADFESIEVAEPPKAVAVGPCTRTSL